MPAPCAARIGMSSTCRPTLWIPIRWSESAHVPSGSCRSRKWRRAGSSVPSARCSSSRWSRASSAANLVDVGGGDVGDAARRRGQGGVVRLLDVAHDAAVEAADAGVAVERDALAGRDPGDEALGLDVAHERRDEIGRLADHLHRPADQAAVVRSGRPLAAVAERPRHLPELQAVVAQVVVQLDQARVDRAPDAYAADGLKAGRGRLIGREHGGDGRHPRCRRRRRRAPCPRRPS